MRIVGRDVLLAQHVPAGLHRVGILFELRHGLDLGIHLLSREEVALDHGLPPRNAGRLR